MGSKKSGRAHPPVEEEPYERSIDNLTIQIDHADNPVHAMFQCALTVSSATRLCVLCMINELQENAMQMVRDGHLHHGYAVERLDDKEPGDTVQ